MRIIEAQNLRREFVVTKKMSGLKGTFKNLIQPERIIKTAVDGIDLAIDEGEIIGFIGPNGAGKSTTIKMLTGILKPTSGSLRVNNAIPYENRKANSKMIGVVFGQRTQLWWNLPVRDSLDLIQTIYKIPSALYRQNVELFIELLDLDQFIDIPVRQLSLGQRMRAEIAASLLHDPKIVYLDEPTIGLDVIAKERIREFISKINQEKKVTIILTTHDMSDIEKLCERIIIIDKGQILYDGQIDQIKNKYGKGRILVADFAESPKNLEIPNGEVIKSVGNRHHILFDRDEITAIQLLENLTKDYMINDFALMETDIDTIIRNLYKEEGA